MERDIADEKTTGGSMDTGAEGRFLLEKINELSPTSRDPVYLSYVEGLSPGEIGDILGISANATSVRINRGIAELRKITGYEN
jgi:DNA-directed RNA polymerase specialized sigma24 family protein